MRKKQERCGELLRRTSSGRKSIPSARSVRRRQGRTDLGERRVQVVAQALHGGDRGNRDQSSDEAVFDGSGALLVTEQCFIDLHVSPQVAASLPVPALIESDRPDVPKLTAVT